MDIGEMIGRAMQEQRDPDKDEEKLTDMQQVTRLRDFDHLCSHDHKFLPGQIVRHHSPNLVPYRTGGKAMMFVKYIEQVNGYDHIDNPDNMTDLNSSREYNCICRVILHGKVVQYLFDSRGLEPHPDFQEKFN